MASDSAENSSWLTQINELVESDELGVVGKDTAVIVRDLLLAPDEDEEATAKAIQALQTYYRTKLCPADDLSWQQDPMDGTLSVIGTVVPHVFEVAQFVPYNDVRNKRLADLLVGLKNSAPAKFDPENPQLGFDDAALREEAYLAWNGSHLTTLDPPLQHTISLNISTLLARLTTPLLGTTGVLRAAAALTEGLEHKPDPADELVARTTAAIATQYVIYAGDALVGAAKAPRKGEEGIVGREKWVIWGKRLGGMVRAEIGEGSGAAGSVGEAEGSVGGRDGTAGEQDGVGEKEGTAVEKERGVAGMWRERISGWCGCGLSCLVWRVGWGSDQ